MYCNLSITFTDHPLSVQNKNLFTDEMMNWRIITSDIMSFYKKKIMKHRDNSNFLKETLFMEETIMKVMHTLWEYIQYTISPVSGE